MKLWHITDTHLPSSGGEVAVAHVLAQMAPLDVVVVTGDITDDGTADQYDLAERLLWPLRGRLLLTPGNHDYGPLGLNCEPAAVTRYRELARDLGSPAPGTRWIVGRWLLLGLDSCRQTEAHLARGHLGSQQLDRLKETLKFADRAYLRTIVALHHAAQDSDPTLLLEDGDEFLKLVWGKADMVLCGHQHGAALEWTAPRGVATRMRRGQDAVGGGVASVWSVEI